MTVSSYQAQQVLAELRKRLGLDAKSLAPDAGVRVQTITILEDDDVPAPREIAPLVVAGTVIDGDAYAPAVAREMERRAGSFMQPPLPPRDAGKPIPKTSKRTSPPLAPRNLGEAD